MQASEYQAAALRTCPRTANPIEDQRSLMFALCGLGIVGEAGEVAELIKKHLFHGHLLDRDKVISELGDVLWYITVLAAELNVPLEVLFEHNISKLRKRYPSGFSPEASKNQEA